jgi:uncharacterized protein YndB with AHSA1/START domain
MKTNGLNLSYDIYIAVPAERVWKSLTESSLTKEYFYGCGVSGDFKKGGALRYSADGMEMMRGEVLEATPNKRLVMTCAALWDDKVKADAPSRLAWELTAMGPTTRLTLMHDDFAKATATYEQCASGWPVILSGMKTVLETGKPLVMGS